MCLIQLDLENAFNLQGCRKIYDSLKERCPGLVRGLRTLYGFRSLLYLGSEERAGLFACGEQDTLLALLQAALAAKEVTRRSLPEGASDFADGMTVFIG